jgi:hypothetical protein
MGDTIGSQNVLKNNTRSLVTSVILVNVWSSVDRSRT